MYSNVSTPDCTITNEQRANRTLELGMEVLSGVEHGWTGRFIETYELSKSNNLKPLYGSEVYFVKDRFEKDKTNAHVIILAKNNDGRKELNFILSEANVSGYYYKARIDTSLLLSLNPKNFWITTSCLGGIWKYDDHEEIVKQWHSHFKENMFLEVQPHHTDSQRDLNRRVLKLSKNLGIKIIAGMDSHMIYPEQAKERDDYLLSRGIEYPDEEGWFLDFPSYEEAHNRFLRQGVMGEKSICEALDNTNVFNEVQEYASNIFNNETIKLPTIYPEKTQKEKDKILWNLLNDEWNKEKKNIPQEKHEHYQEEIKKEFNIIRETGMSDYFILNYHVVKIGKEMGGSITLTGRGSAPSFYTTKLLGLTTVDRIGATVKLFPERFISKERLLETKSLPDVDFNLGTPEIFSKAQEKVLGEGHSYKMIAFGTVKTLGAWKLYARVAGIDFETSNAISDKIKEYENQLKHLDDDEKEHLKIDDFIGTEYSNIFEEAKKYIGLVNTLTPHPCAYLLYSDEDIRKEFGLIKIKTGSVEHLCVNVDGLYAEKYKFLKNDLLKVSVVDLIYRVYNRIGVSPHPLPELLRITNGDSDVWNIYSNALGIGINQVEQPGTIHRVAKYKPKNISELSAFIAAIRPGFKSNYKQFEARENFSYGVKTIDELIQTEEFPQSYMLYQENAMQVMAYAGIPISETYDVIKNIAKKRIEKVLSYKEKFLSEMTNKLMVEFGADFELASTASEQMWNNVEKTSDGVNFSHISSAISNKDYEKSVTVARNIWQVIEDSSRYSFNSSHAYSVAGDSLYGAYLKSKYPIYFYEQLLVMLENDGDKDRLRQAKEEAEFFDIKFPSYKFGQDNRSIVADAKTNSISSSLTSLKGFGKDIGEKLYELGKIKFESFVDMLVYSEENSIISSKFEALIKINYFDIFGKNGKLLSIWNEFKNGKNKYTKKLSDKSKNQRIEFLKNFEHEQDNIELNFQEQLRVEVEILGRLYSKYEEIDKKVCVIEDVNMKYSTKIVVARSLKTGKNIIFKVSGSVYDKNSFSNGDVIYISSYSKEKPKKRLTNGAYVDTDGELVLWVRSYDIVKNIENYKTGEIK